MALVNRISFEFGKKGFEIYGTPGNLVIVISPSGKKTYHKSFTEAAIEYGIMQDKAYVIDLTCNGNCYEGTELECERNIDDLVYHYGHERKNYAISFNRFD